MISAMQLPLHQFFPNNYFTIPGFQRPYVWGKDEIETLLDDLVDAQLANLQDYFIGNIVFYTEFRNNFNTAIILDGQQRLTTIFLLLAVIRDRLNSPQIQVILQYNVGLTQRSKIEYEIRPDVTNYVNNEVIPMGSTLLPSPVIYGDKSAKNMKLVVGIMNTWFNNNPNINLLNFYQYMLNNVFIVSVSSQNMSDALRLFTVLNNRGVKLRASDILKADNLSVVPNNLQNTYATKWEQIESAFDDDAFDDFLLHIRSIIVKTKAQKNLLDEFKEIYRNNLLQKGHQTFDLIERYKCHFDDLMSQSYIPNDLRLFNIIQILDKTIKSKSWIPVVLFFKDKFGNQNLVDFVLALEKKFTADWLNGMSLTPRINAMNDIMKVIEAEPTPAGVISHHAMTYSKQFVSLINNQDIYGSQYTKYLLAKLCFIFGAPHQAIIQFAGTIEHILPQNPPDTSQWCIDYNIQQQTDCLHKIGNLILLDRGKNSQLSNLDFTDKKTRYFGRFINMYPYSIRVMSSHNTWTFQDYKSNHDSVVDELNRYY